MSQENVGVVRKGYESIVVGEELARRVVVLDHHDRLAACHLAPFRRHRIV
jgi:hypothetical protein